MDASIEVLSSSLGPPENWCSRDRASSLLLHARVRVLPKDSQRAPFSIAKLTLYGAIRSEIGSKTGLEKILQVSAERYWTDFATGPKESPESHFDVAFDVSPRTVANDCDGQSFIPSFSLKGQTHVTTSDVLSSQQLVKGGCEVIYWIEAEFTRGFNVIHRMKVPVDISTSSAPMQMQVSANTKADAIEEPVKPLKRAMLRRGWPLKPRKYLTPKIAVQVPKDLGFVYGATTKSYTNYQLIAVPLTFVITQPTSDDPCCTDMMGKFLMNASVEARWYTTKTFSTSSVSGKRVEKNDIHSPRITKKTVVKQKQLLNFPPFYQERPYETLAAEVNSKFSATAMLELLLPDTINCPTVNTDLLKVSYELELEVSMDGEKNGVVPCAAKMMIPVTITTA